MAAKRVNFETNIGPALASHEAEMCQDGAAWARMGSKMAQDGSSSTSMGQDGHQDGPATRHNGPPRPFSGRLGALSRGLFGGFLAEGYMLLKHNQV